MWHRDHSSRSAGFSSREPHRSCERSSMLASFSADSDSLPYLLNSSRIKCSSRFAGSKFSMNLTLCFSQWPTRSLNRVLAHATPPSRNAQRSWGNRRVTPPKKSDLQIASAEDAKWPMWLYMKLEIEVRLPQPTPME